MSGFSVFREELFWKGLDKVNLTPTEGMKAAARRGLESRRKAPKSKKGGLSTQEAGKQGIGSGVARANQIISGKELSPETVRRMHSFFSRHSAYKHKHASEPDGKAKQSWDLWGGDAGRTWAAAKVKELDRAIESKTKKSLSGFGVVVL